MIKEGNKSNCRGVYLLDKKEYNEIINRNKDKKEELIQKINKEQKGRTVRWNDKWKQELI